MKVLATKHLGKLFNENVNECS